MSDGYSIWPPALIGLALFAVGVFVVVVLWRIWRRSQWGGETRYRVGDQMAGARVVVDDWSGHEGLVHVDGEMWRAVSDETLSAGDKVVVTRVDGLTLEVKKKQ